MPPTHFLYKHQPYSLHYGLYARRNINKGEVIGYATGVVVDPKVPVPGYDGAYDFWFGDDKTDLSTRAGGNELRFANDPGNKKQSFDPKKKLFSSLQNLQKQIKPKLPSIPIPKNGTF